MAKLTLKGFEKFTAKRRVATHDPVITIGKGGRMSINKFAYEKYFKVFRYAELYYNPDESIMALKLFKEASENAYEIKKAAAGNFAAINAIAFFKHNKIDVEAKRNTEFLEMDEKNVIIYLKIKGT